MKINGTDRVGAVNRYQKHQDLHQAGTGQKAGKKKDQVEISNQAKELLETQGATSGSNERIEALKHSVSTGTYHVDAGKIAEKLFPFIR